MIGMLSRDELGVLGAMSSTTSLIITIITLVVNPKITIRQTSVAGVVYDKVVPVSTPLLILSIVLMAIGLVMFYKYFNE